MKRRQFISLPLPVLFLTLTSTVMASNTWYVDGVNGSDANDCQSALTGCKTIEHAISLASSSDSIIVAAATYTENLTIGFSLNVIGSGASTTVIDGGNRNAVVNISNANAQVTLANLTVRNGVRRAGGGGIINSGRLTISNSTISGNSGVNSCTTGTCNVYGGGISNSGTLTISNSTISGNSAGLSCHFGGCQGSSSGGAIFNMGKLTMNNVTISGNTSSVYCLMLRGACVATGGGILNYGVLAINNGTLSGNSVSYQCSKGLQCSAHGGGVYSYEFFSGRSFGFSLQNSIVSSNTGGNCSGLITSNGYNLSSDSTCDLTGTGDLNNYDPLLGSLQNNGGPTETMALLPGSPAIDAGNPNGCTDGQGGLLTTDQRGMPRPDPGDTGGCDRGAYEVQSN